MLIPFSSLRRTLVFVLVRSLGVTPPPQRFVRSSASTLRLADIEDVPRAASRRRRASLRDLRRPARSVADRTERR